MTPQQPPYQQPYPPQYAPQAPVQHRAASRPSRWPFWVLVAFHVLVVITLLGGGKDQTVGDTFAVLGSGAAVDVMVMALWWAWRGGPGR